MRKGLFHFINTVLSFLLTLSMVSALSLRTAAQEKSEKSTPIPGPMLSQGFLELEAPDFALTLVRSSQTVAALKPKGGNGFDFTPEEGPAR